MHKPDISALRSALRAYLNAWSERDQGVWEAVIEPMAVMWYPPPGVGDGDAADHSLCIALQGYLEDLREFDRATLDAGWVCVRRLHAGRSWPTINAIRTACQAERSNNNPTPAKKPDNFSRHDYEADRCMRHPFGQKAIAEGWGWELFCFVRDNGEWPKGARVDRMKEARLRAEIALCDLPQESPFHGPLSRLFVAIQSRETWIKEKYG